MGRRLNLNPSYLLHSGSGRARAIVHDHLGARREILLPGKFNSRESRAEYARICALLRANGGRLPAPSGAGSDVSISELVLRYLDEHATSYYVDPVTKEPTSELECLRCAFRPLNRLCGSLRVSEFDSLKLEALQQALATGSWLTDDERAAKAKRRRPVGLARSTINHHVERIKRLFRWGCAKKIVAPECLVNIQAVASLRRGRSQARETVPVTPIAPEIVEKTLPHLPPAPADIIRILLLTGARVGEICRLTGRELERSGPIWLYRPSRHKAAHRGHERVIAMGPKAQLILRRYLKSDEDALLFCPAEQDALRKMEMRRQRKTRVQPSQLSRAKAGPQRKPGREYTHNSINNAIRRACRKAGLERWHVHQLRHTASLLVMREHGAEAARSVLGHQQLNTTMHYAGIDLERAKEVAAKSG